MEKSKKVIRSVSIIIIFIGIGLLLVGIFAPVPSNHLISSEYVNGVEIRDGYTCIQEYVGGDAYNYIIGASMTGGMIAGSFIAKAIFIVGGLILFCMGLKLIVTDGRKEKSVPVMSSEPNSTVLNEFVNMPIPENENVSASPEKSNVQENEITQ